MKQEVQAALDAVARERMATMKAPEEPITMASLNVRLTALENAFKKILELKAKE
jgi:hypothetical protein